MIGKTLSKAAKRGLCSRQKAIIPSQISHETSGFCQLFTQARLKNAAIGHRFSILCLFQKLAAMSFMKLQPPKSYWIMIVEFKNRIAVVVSALKKRFGEKRGGKS